MQNSPLARDKISQVYLGDWGDEYTQSRARRRIEWLASNTQGPKVLDVGCSEGILGILLGREGFLVDCIDVNTDALEYAKDLLSKEHESTRKNVSYERKSIFDNSIDERNYDTVVMAEVIEHLFHPEVAIKNAVSLIKNNGRLLLTTPFGYFPDPDHHQTFNISNIVELLSRHVEIVELSVIDSYILVIGLKNIPKNSEISTEKVLDITEHALIQSQKSLRKTITRAIEEKKEYLINNNSTIKNLKTEYEGKIKNILNDNKMLAESSRQDQKIYEELRSVYNHFRSENENLKGTIRKLHSDSEGASNNLYNMKEKNLQLNFMLNSLKKDAEEKNRALANVQNQLSLKAQAFQQAVSEKNLVLNNFKQTKNSEAWKIGYVTVKAFAQPGKNTLLWPLRLLKILFGYLGGHERPAPFHPASPAKTPDKPHVAKEQMDKKRVRGIETLFPGKPGRTGSFQLREAVTAGNLSEARVACVMDEFTYNAFSPECELLQLTPDGWEKELSSLQPDLLFIESAWRGKDDLWNRKIVQPEGELTAIVAWCNRHNIPTVFWNKEDPVHFQSFIRTAGLFDYVFTTDITCIQKYKTILRSDRVYLLPFAAQPELHNPVERFARKDAFCFAGAYYPRYPERMKDFACFYDSLTSLRDFDIYDRNFNDPDSEFAFPERFRKNILGYLPHDKIDIAYKGYRYGINMNSIKQSPTMFARRVFELIASNTVTVSNYSRGISEMFGDLVVTSDDPGSLRRKLEKISSDDSVYKRLRLKALRKLMLEHTYGHRFSYIAEKVWNLTSEGDYPGVSVIALVRSDEDVKSVTCSFNRQDYGKKKLFLVCDRDFQLDPEHADVDIYSIEKARDIPVSDLLNEDYIASFDPEDYYGEHYLLDTVLARRYSDADIIGKGAFFTYKNQSFQLENSDNEYKEIKQLPYRSSIFPSSLLDSTSLLDWALNISSGVIDGYKCLSIDPYNYCKQYSGDSCPTVDDLEGIDQGVHLSRLNSQAEAITPQHTLQALTHIDGGQLFEYLSTSENEKVLVRKMDNGLRIISTLLGDESYQIRGSAFIPLDNLLNKKQLKVFFDINHGMNLKLYLSFFAEDYSLLGERRLEGNRNNRVSPPEGSMYFRMGLHVSQKGVCLINRVVFDEVSIAGQAYHGRAQRLLVTYEYPSHENLYRFGFVHSRAVQYKQKGLDFDIIRCNEYYPKGYYEFLGHDVISDNADSLQLALAQVSGPTTLLIHYLVPDMWRVLNHCPDHVNLIIWLHGAEVQPWHRRSFNFTTEAEKQKAVWESDQRLALWREVFSNARDNMHFVFVSRYFAEEVMEDVGVRLPEENISIIPNPIDTALFSYVPKSADQRKRVLSIRPYASRKYANDLSVQAVQALSKEPFFKELEFLFVGDGVLFEETLSPLRQFNNITIQQGFLKHEEIAALHKKFGVFLTPTRMDSQGVSRDEAMSSGLVPVTNNVTAIPEFVDADSGMLAEPEDYLGMAEAVTRLYNDPDLFTRLSANAAERVRNQSSVEQTIDREINLIRRMEGGKGM